MTTAVHGLYHQPAHFTGLVYVAAFVPDEGESAASTGGTTWLP